MFQLKQQIYDFYSMLKWNALYEGHSSTNISTYVKHQEKPIYQHHSEWGWKQDV